MPPQPSSQDSPGQKQDTKPTFDGDDIDDDHHGDAIYDDDGDNDDDDGDDDDDDDDDDDADIEGAPQQKQDSKPNHEIEGRTF